MSFLSVECKRTKIGMVEVLIRQMNKTKKFACFSNFLTSGLPRFLFLRTLSTGLSFYFRSFGQNGIIMPDQGDEVGESNTAICATKALMQGLGTRPDCHL